MTHKRAVIFILILLINHCNTSSPPIFATLLKENENSNTFVNGSRLKLHEQHVLHKGDTVIVREEEATLQLDSNSNENSYAKIIANLRGGTRLNFVGEDNNFISLGIESGRGIFHIYPAQKKIFIVTPTIEIQVADVAKIEIDVTADECGQRTTVKFVDTTKIGNILYRSSLARYFISISDQKTIDNFEERLQDIDDIPLNELLPEKEVTIRTINLQQDLERHGFPISLHHKVSKKYCERFKEIEKDIRGGENYDVVSNSRKEISSQIPTPLTEGKSRGIVEYLLGKEKRNSKIEQGENEIPITKNKSFSYTERKLKKNYVDLLKKISKGIPHLDSHNLRQSFLNGTYKEYISAQLNTEETKSKIQEAKEAINQLKRIENCFDAVQFKNQKIMIKANDFDYKGGKSFLNDGKIYNAGEINDWFFVHCEED